MAEQSKSKRERGAENVTALLTYLSEHKADDLDNLEEHTLPMYMGSVNKSQIADEIGFGRSAFRQNPAIQKIMRNLEDRLGSGANRSEQGGSPRGGRGDRRTRDLEQRVNRLETRVAALQAENSDLRGQLRKLGWVDEHMPGTGRLPW